MDKKVLEMLKKDLAKAVKEHDYERIEQLKIIMNLNQEQCGYIDRGLTGYASIDQTWKKFYTQDSLKSTESIIQNKTVWDVIEEKLIEFYDVPTIDYFKKIISSEEFIERVYIWARTFKAMGVEPDEIVPIYGPFVPDIGAMALALNSIGATPYFLKLAISPSALEEETRDSKIAVVYDGMWKNVAHEFSKDKFKKVIVATVPEDMPSPKKEIVSFLSYIQAKKNKSQIPKEKKYIWLDEAKKIADYYTGEVKEKYVPNRNAFITSSSGTTLNGVVKGTIATNESTLAQLQMAKASYISYDRGDKCLNNFPPTASTSLNILFLYALYQGLTIIMDPRVTPNDFYNQVINLKPNVVLTTGSFWEIFFNRVKKEMEQGRKFDFSFAKGWFLGGEGTDFQKYKKWNEIMRINHAQNEIFSGYGSSELFSAISLEKPNAKTEETKNILSVGIPYAGINVGVFDENGNELQYGQRGELWIKSRTSMKEYYLKPELTSQILVDGWVHTGDLAEIDENGFIYIWGRINDKITLDGGENVYLFDIAYRLKKLDFIEDAMVLSMPLVENNNNLVAHIVWTSQLNQQDKIEKINLINSIINEQTNGKLNIGAYSEHDTMLPYSPTTLKKDKNKLFNQNSGYYNAENNRLVEIEIISTKDGKILKKYDTIEKNRVKR